jgi:hypothetical protein
VLVETEAITDVTDEVAATVVDVRDTEVVDVVSVAVAAGGGGAVAPPGLLVVVSSSESSSSEVRVSGPESRSSPSTA